MTDQIRLAKAIVYGKMHTVSLPDGEGIRFSRVAAVDDLFDFYGVLASRALIRNRDIIEYMDDPLPVYGEDPAQVDADLACQEVDDWQEYHDQNFHAR